MKPDQYPRFRARIPISQQDGPASQVLKSPSSMTLKQREKPFLKLGYALQVSLGPRILLEVPLNIHPIPLYAHGVEFKPFVAGTQNFHEADESDKKPFKTPFEYVPRYPVYTTDLVSTVSDPNHELSITANGDVELNRTVEINDLPNGDRIILSKEEMIIVHNRDSDHSGAPSPSPHRKPAAESAVEQTEVVSDNVSQGDHVERDLVREKRSEPEDEPKPLPEATAESEAAPEPQTTMEKTTKSKAISKVETTPEQSASIEILKNHLKFLNKEREDYIALQESDEQNAMHEETRVTTMTDKDGEQVTTVTHEVNGGIKTVTTEKYDASDYKVQKTIENYEYTDENGVRVEVQKTVEQTLVPSEVHIPTNSES